MTRGEDAQPKKEFAVESSTGAAFNRFWEELAQEAERYVALVKRLKRMDASDPRRTDLEGELYASLSHIATHARLLLEAADEALESSD